MVNCKQPLGPAELCRPIANVKTHVFCFLRPRLGLVVRLCLGCLKMDQRTADSPGTLELELIYLTCLPFPLYARGIKNHVNSTVL